MGKAKNLNAKMEQSRSMYPIDYLSQIVLALFILNSIMDSIVDNAWVVLVAILSGVVSFLIGELLWASLKKPKLVIEISNVKQGKLGFSVHVRKKFVRNATVRCDDVEYNWEKDDETKSREVDLRIGDRPVTFYPYKVSVVFVETLVGYENVVYTPQARTYIGGALISVEENVTKTIVYCIVYAIPDHFRLMLGPVQIATEHVFVAHIKITGEGIEEESNYVIYVGLDKLLIHAVEDKSKALIDYVDFDCRFKIKKLFRKQRA